jgi:hypothetical protein
VAGCDITRSTLAKVEAQIRGVTDIELFVIARVLQVPINDLYPQYTAKRLKEGTALKAT